MISNSEIDMELLRNTAQIASLHDYEIMKSRDSQFAYGFTGKVIAIDIIGRDNENKKKTLHLVVKSSTKSVDPTYKAIYDREIYMYTTVFPKFYEMEKEKGLPALNLAPKFYNQHVGNNSTSIILENLKSIGYCMHSQQSLIDDDHLKLVMRQYGRLHALSFALRDQDFRAFTRLFSDTDKLFETFLTGFQIVALWKCKCIAVKDVFNSTTEREYFETYESFLNTIDDFIKELLQYSDKYFVIIHGDCSTNNILFKYEHSAGDSPSNTSRFIDFQLSHLGSPAQDIAQFFYTCTSHQQMENLNEYLMEYYNSLSEHLKKLGSDPNKMFPYTAFQGHWKKYAKCGLLIGITVIYFMLTEKHEVVDLQKYEDAGNKSVEVFNYKIANIDEYRSRVRNLILHFINNKYI